MDKEVDISGRSVVVAIPCVDGTIDIRIAIALLNATHLLAQYGVKLAVTHMSYCSSISRARNALANAFLKTDFTDLLFIDDDTVSDARSIVQIMAKATGRDIVAGAVPILKGDGKSYRFKPVVTDSIEPNDEGLIEVERVGTAFMCIRRHVLESLSGSVDSYWVDQSQEHHKRFFSEEYDEAGAFWGEDYFFCKEAVADGHRIWVDVDIAFSHVKKIDLKGHFRQDIPGMTILDGDEATKGKPK